ncbi:MAG: restriction endonuclease subunit S [Anaerolineales bacterium]|nr:restriction endonuclease subunit S [Anaerolineales bacterium]MCB8992275.1 restriction endonuclease subunit S [Ardenticatenaceae bacterium]
MRIFESLPPSWRLSPFGELTTLIQYGLTATASENVEGIFYLRISDIDDNGNVNLADSKYVPEEIANVEKYGLEQGDIVIARSGSVGRSFVYQGSDEPWVFASYLIRFRPNQEIVNPDYLGFYLHSLYYWHYVNAMTRVGAQPNINSKELSNLPVPVPPLPEQERIVAILRQADELRRLRQQAHTKADTLLSSIFHEMFGDPAANPHKWETRELQTVCERITDGTHQPPPFEEKGEVPFLFVSNIVGGKIDFNTEKHISPETHASLMKRCPVEVGDILYSTVGSYGIAVVVDTERPFAFQRHIAHIKPLHDQINPYFLRTLMNTPYLKAQADRVARGIAQKTVNLGEINRFHIYLPPYPLQNEFASKALAFEQAVEQEVNQSIIELNNLFQSLLAKAFNGELTAVYRQQHQAELQEAAVQRDIALGLREKEPRLIDFEKGRVTPEEEEQFRHSIQQAFRPAIQDLLASSGTKNVVASLTQQLNFPKLADLIRPALPTYENLVSDVLADSIASTNEIIRASLASNLDVITQSITAPLAESVRLSTADFYQSLGQRIMALADAQVRQAAQQEPPQPHRAIHTELDAATGIILQAIQALSTYFTPSDLHQLMQTYGHHFDSDRQLDLVQVETALQLLETLGFVRQVMVDERLVYRLVDPVEDGALLPEELAE